jgi:hypothetical protein
VGGNRDRQRYIFPYSAETLFHWFFSPLNAIALVFQIRYSANSLLADQMASPVVHYHFYYSASSGIERGNE